MTRAGRPAVWDVIVDRGRLPASRIRSLWPLVADRERQNGQTYGYRSPTARDRSSARGVTVDACAGARLATQLLEIRRRRERAIDG